MSLASRSTRGALFLGISTFANIVIGFFGGILLARLLEPNDFGTFALATTLFAFADVRVKLQLEQKFLRDQDDRAAHLNTFFTVSLGLSLISFFGLLIVAAIIVGLNRTDLAICILTLAALGLIDPLTSVIRLSIEKQVAFRAVSVIQTLAAVVQFGTTLLCALIGLGLWSLLIGTVVGGLINLGMFLRVAPRRPQLQLDRVLAREFIAYGIKYGSVYAVSAITLTQFDNFIIGLLSGTFVLGFYDRAYRTALWPTLLVSSALGRISLPMYSQLQDDAARAGKAFSMVLWTILTCTTPIALILLVTAPDLVSILYGDKWLPSVPILQVLALFSILRPLWDDLISILVATKRPGQMARLVFIQACVLILFAIPLTWFYGGVGAATSVGIAFVISAVFLFYFGKTQLKVDLVRVAGIPLLNNFIALVLYLLIRLNLSLETVSSLWRLGIEAALLLGLYALTSLLLSGRTLANRLVYVYQLVREK